MNNNNNEASYLNSSRSSVSSGNSSNYTLAPSFTRSSMPSTPPSLPSNSFKGSPRSSITSSSVISKYASGMTATSTYSSIDEHDGAFTSNSSAIGFLSDSITSGEDFGIIDTLDYEDVDDGLIGHEYMHRSREAWIENLLATEQAYTESLELVMQVFLLPLRKDAKQSTFLGMKKMVCTEREFRWLFGNFEELIHTHKLILQSLQERLRIYGPQILSDVFQAWFPNLDCYRDYLNNYAVALTTYERLTRYQPFKKFLDAAHKDKLLKGASLLSLLQLPSRCITRYLDVMTKIADATPPMHPDYPGLQKCKMHIQRFHHNIKEKLIDIRNVDQVLTLHQAIVGAPFSVRAERRLVIQGQLSRVVLNTRSMGEERSYMLFTDMLVFVKSKEESGKLQYKGHLNLERSRVRALTKEEANGFAHCIEITSSFAGVDNLNTTYVGSPTVLVLYIGSDDERNQWLVALERVISNLDKIALAKHVQATKRMVQSRQPRNNSTVSGTSTVSSNDESTQSISSRESSSLKEL